MNRAEVSALLTFAATIDYRKVGDADVQAWHLFLRDVALDDAQAAVVAHYTQSRERMMPADILAGVKAVRAEQRRNEPHEIRALPSRFERADMGDQVRIARGMGTVRAALAPVLEHLAKRSGRKPGEAAAELRALTAGPRRNTDIVDGEAL